MFRVAPHLDDRGSLGWSAADECPVDNSIGAEFMVESGSVQGGGEPG